MEFPLAQICPQGKCEVGECGWEGTSRPPRPLRSSSLGLSSHFEGEGPHPGHTPCPAPARLTGRRPKAPGGPPRVAPLPCSPEDKGDRVCGRASLTGERRKQQNEVGWEAEEPGPEAGPALRRSASIPGFRNFWASWLPCAPLWAQFPRQAPLSPQPSTPPGLLMPPP